MSYYVMSDIHGCYDEMIKMFEQVKFTHNDTLIFAGDYIDRGPKSFEMLRWIESCPDNVILLRGNHDEEFASNIDLMDSYCKKNCLSEDSEDDTKLLYETIRGISAQ